MTKIAGIPEELQALSRALDDVAPEIERTSRTLSSVSLPEMPPSVAGAVSDTLGSVGQKLNEAATTGARTPRKPATFAFAQPGRSTTSGAPPSGAESSVTRATCGTAAAAAVRSCSTTSAASVHETCGPGRATSDAVRMARSQSTT